MIVDSTWFNSPPIILWLVLIVLAWGIYKNLKE